MPEHIEGSLLAGDAPIAIVASRFNDFLTTPLVEAAVNTYVRHGGDADRLTVCWVPGSLEIPVTAMRLARKGTYEAVVCLGCVIRGETDHYDCVTQQAARGIAEVSHQTGVPCIFGLITAHTLEQAVNRAGAKLANQGAKSMTAAIEMVNLLKKL